MDAEARDTFALRLHELPFDLVRHEVLMTFKPVAAETILEIVDDIFLPLVSHRSEPAGDPVNPPIPVTTRA